MLLRTLCLISYTTVWLFQLFVVKSSQLIYMHTFTSHLNEGRRRTQPTNSHSGHQGRSQDFVIGGAKRKFGGGASLKNLKILKF